VSIDGGLTHSYVICRTPHVNKIRDRRMIIVAEISSYMRAWVICQRIRRDEHCWSVVLKRPIWIPRLHSDEESGIVDIGGRFV